MAGQSLETASMVIAEVLETDPDESDDPTKTLFLMSETKLPTFDKNVCLRSRMET